MSKEYLTERKICAVAILHTQVFDNCKAMTSEGVFQHMRASLCHRTLVSQSETLVRCKRSMAAEVLRVGVMDVDSFYSVAV